VGLAPSAHCYWRERDSTLRIVFGRSGDFVQRFISPVGYRPITATVAGRPLELKGPKNSIYTVAGTATAERGAEEELVVTFSRAG
jgi:hypothetical protein